MTNTKVFEMLKSPLGMWLVAFAFAVQYSPILMFRIKGGLVICIIYAMGFFLLATAAPRAQFMRCIDASFKGNASIFAALFFYYCFVVAAWFYAPYEIGYTDVQHIWKFHVLNIFALIAAMYLSERPRYKIFVLYLLAPVVLWHTQTVKAYLNVMGGEIRNYLGDDGGGGGLGGSQVWEAVSMYAVALTGYVMSERRIVVKILGGLLILYLAKCVLSASFATPMGLLLIGMAMVFYSAFRYRKSRLANGLKMFALFVIVVTGMAIVFVKISKSYDSGNDEYQSISVRFKNLIESPMGGGYDEEHSRFQLMETSWNSFKESPLFGMGGEYPSPRYITNGGHQSFIDYLGVYGLVGSSFFYLFLYLTYRNLKRKVRDSVDYRASANMAIWIMFLVGGIVNPMWMGLSMSAFLVLSTPYKRCTEDPQSRNRPVGPYARYYPVR